MIAVHDVTVELSGVVAAKSGEAAKAGPIGLAVILLLCIACYFLFKSMSKHLRNVRENFPPDGVDGPTSAVRRGSRADEPAASAAPRATERGTPSEARPGSAPESRSQSRSEQSGPPVG